MLRSPKVTLLRAALAAIGIALLWWLLDRAPPPVPDHRVWWRFAGLAVFFVGLAGVVRDYWRYGRDPEIPSPHHAFEHPSDLPPGAVAVLTKTYSWVDARRAFQATVIDLARRGYGEFTSPNGWFEMRLDLAKPTDELHAFERKVLDYLKEAARQHPDGDDAHLEYGELVSYTYAHSKAFLGAWGIELRDWVEARFGGGLITPESHAAARRWANLAFIGIFGFWFTFFVSAPFTTRAMPLFPALTVVCLWLAYEILYFMPAWREEVAREVYGWQAFRRTLRDYSRMKEAPDDFFVLWDRYYSYAVALGVAERFIENLNWAAPLSVREEDKVDPENHPYPYLIIGDRRT